MSIAKILTKLIIKKILKVNVSIVYLSIILTLFMWRLLYLYVLHSSMRSYCFYNVTVSDPIRPVQSLFKICLLTFLLLKMFQKLHLIA